jgi:hypothetical protein
MQDIIAISIVAIAASFLVHRMWRLLVRRTTGACGACSGCNADVKSHAQHLITISPLNAHAKARSREESVR